MHQATGSRAQCGCSCISSALRCRERCGPEAAHAAHTPALGLYRRAHPNSTRLTSRRGPRWRRPARRTGGRGGGEGGGHRSVGVGRTQQARGEARGHPLLCTDTRAVPCKWPSPRHGIACKAAAGRPPCGVGSHDWFSGFPRCSQASYGLSVHSAPAQQPRPFRFEGPGAPTLAVHVRAHTCGLTGHGNAAMAAEVPGTEGVDTTCVHVLHVHACVCACVCCMEWHDQPRACQRMQGVAIAPHLPCGFSLAHAAKPCKHITVRPTCLARGYGAVCRWCAGRWQTRSR